MSDDADACISRSLNADDLPSANHLPSPESNPDSAMSGTVALPSAPVACRPPSVHANRSESMPESNLSSTSDPSSAPSDRTVPIRRSSLRTHVDSPHQPTSSSFRSSLLSTAPILSIPLDDVHHHPLQLDTDSDENSDAITAIPVSRLRSTSDASAPTSPPIPVPSRRQSHAVYDTIASDRHIRRASSLNTITPNSTLSRHFKALSDASTIPPPSPQDSNMPTVVSPSSSHLPPLDLSRPLTLLSTSRGDAFSPERSTISEFPNPALFKPRSMSSASRDDHVDNPVTESENDAKDNVPSNGTPPAENQNWTFAHKRRNAEFHEIFSKLPKEDHLIDDFACNLQKEPPAQGRLYVSERHISFSTKILWVQAHQVSIPFPEVLTLEKRNGPSGTIEISTIATKFTFSGFVNSDSVYDMLRTIWTQMGPKQNIKLTTFRKSVVPSKRSTSPVPSITRGGSATPAPSIGSTTFSTKSKSSSKKCPHIEDAQCDVCASASGTEEDGMVSESSVLVDSTSLSDTSSSLDTTEIRDDDLDDDDDTKNEVEAYIYEAVKNELTQAAKLEEEEQMREMSVEVVKSVVVEEEKSEETEVMKMQDEVVKVEDDEDVHRDTQSEQQLTVTAASVDRVKAAEKKLTNRLSAGSLASLFTGMSTNSLLSNTSSGSSGIARNVGGLVGDAIEGPSAGASPASVTKPDPSGAVRNFLASLGMQQVSGSGNGSAEDGKATPPKSPATTKMPTLAIDSPMSKTPNVSQPNSNTGSATTTSASGGEEGTPERARSMAAAEAPPLGLAEIAAAVAAGSGALSPVGIANPSDGGYDTDNSLVITTTVTSHPHIIHQPHQVRRGSAASVFGSLTHVGTKHGAGEDDAEAKQKRRKKRRAKVGRIVATGKCGCEDTHKKMVGVMDVTVPGSMEAVWALLYGDRPLVGSFYRSFLEKRKIKDTRSTSWADPSPGPQDSDITDIPEGPEKDHKYLGSLAVGTVRRQEYLMPVSNPIGPKAVMCKVREELLKYMPGNNVCVRSTSQTPDAPSGSSFATNLRCCMISDPGSNGKATRLRVSCEVEWFKGSWLKMAIDQAAPQGIRSHQHDLLNVLKAYLTTQGSAVESRVAKHLPAIAEEDETDDDEDDDGTGLGVSDPSASLRVGATQLQRTKDPLFHPLAEEVERLGKHGRRNEDDVGVEDEVEALLQNGVIRRGRWGLRRGNTGKGSNAPTRSSSLGRPNTPTSPTIGRVGVGGGGGGWGWEAVGVWVVIVVVIVVLCGVMWMMVWMGMLVVKMEERMRVLEGLVREQTGLMRGMVGGRGLWRGEFE